MEDYASAGVETVGVANDPASIPLWLALLPLGCLIALLTLAVMLFGERASSGPSQLALMFAAVITVGIGVSRGQDYEELETAIIDTIRLAFKACLILLLVGAMIGSWMLAGTAPAVIHLGLGLLDPGFFYPAALLLCACVALAVGSSWTTAATVGMALVGVAGILGLSPEIAAGAVISGAYFGDKMSPLSDSTNLAPAMVNVDLFVHIRHMLWTTTPSILIALILFTWLGWEQQSSADIAADVASSRALLADSYRLGLPALLPLILLLWLAWRRLPALPTIVAGVMAGCLVAVVFQGEMTRAFGDPDVKLGAPAATLKGLWLAMSTGFQASTGDSTLDGLLSRGGMSSMLTTVWLIIAAMCFGGAMEQTGLLGRIVSAALRGVRGTGSLILVTVLTAIGMNVIAADQYISIVLPGRMYQLEFKRRGLAAQNLSRTLEDAGTMTSALVPWNTCGAFMASTLGVATLAYAPYAFFNLISPCIAVAYGFLDFRIVRLEEPHCAHSP